MDCGRLVGTIQTQIDPKIRFSDRPGILNRLGRGGKDLVVRAWQSAVGRHRAWAAVNLVVALGISNAFVQKSRNDLFLGILIACVAMMVLHDGNGKFLRRTTRKNREKFLIPWDSELEGLKILLFFILRNGKLELLTFKRNQTR
jgi:hypothetical protein